MEQESISPNALEENEPTQKLVEYLSAGHTDFDCDYVQKLLDDGADANAEIQENGVINRLENHLQPVPGYKPDTSPILYLFFRDGCFKSSNLASFWSVVVMLIRAGADPLITLSIGLRDARRVPPAGKTVFLYWTHFHLLYHQRDRIYTNEEVGVILDAVDVCLCQTRGLESISTTSFVDFVMETGSMQIIQSVLDHLSWEKKVRITFHAWDCMRLKMFDRGDWDFQQAIFSHMKLFWDVLGRNQKLLQAINSIRDLPSCFRSDLNWQVSILASKWVYVRSNGESMAKYSQEMIHQARICLSLPADIRPSCRSLHICFGKYIGGGDAEEWKPEICSHMNLRLSCKAFQRPGNNVLVDYDYIHPEDYRPILNRLPNYAMMIIFSYLFKLSVGERSDIFCINCIDGILPRVCKAFVKCPVEGVVRINRDHARDCVFGLLDDDAFKAFFKHLVHAMPRGYENFRNRI